jgi:hypothetical protein
LELCCDESLEQVELGEEEKKRREADDSKSSGFCVVEDSSGVFISNFQSNFIKNEDSNVTLLLLTRNLVSSAGSMGGPVI